MIPSHIPALCSLKKHTKKLTVHVPPKYPPPTNVETRVPPLERDRGWVSSEHVVFFKDFKDVFQRKEIIFFYPKQQGVYFVFFVDAMNYEPSTFKQARTSHIYEAKQMDIFQ